MVNVPALSSLDAFEVPQSRRPALPAAANLKMKSGEAKKAALLDVVVPQSTDNLFLDSLNGLTQDDAIIPEFKAPLPKQQRPQVPALDFLDMEDWTSPFDLDLDFGSVFDSWDESTLLFGAPQTTGAGDRSVAPSVARAQQPAASTVAPEQTSSEDSEDVDEFTRNRRACLERYREKKRNRRFSKKVRYHLRKMNADRRPRYKGRFIKKGEVIPQHLLDAEKAKKLAAAAAKK